MPRSGSAVVGGCASNLLAAMDCTVRAFASYLQSVGKVPVKSLTHEGSSRHPLAVGGVVQIEVHAVKLSFLLLYCDGA